MIKKTIALFLSATLSATILMAAQTMVGNVGMREASVWIQADGQFAIMATASAKDKTSSTAALKRFPHNTNGWTSTAVFTNLSPNTHYDYVVNTSDGKEIAKGSFKTQADFKDRTPPPDFSFAVFGENYLNDKEFDPPFKTPGAEYEIYAAADAKNPAFAIWVDGMNTLRNADLDSALAKLSRAANARNIPEIKGLLTKRANYGVVAQKSYFGKSKDANTANVRDCAEIFDFAWANPTSKFDKTKAYSFTYSDAEFFILDDCTNRSYFDYRAARPTYLGEAQLKWLMGALQNSKANFKFVILNSPFANPANNRDNFTFSADERKALNEFLVFAKIEGVVFISANKPYGELSRLIRAGGYPIYDLTAGPLTGRPAAEATEMNYFRIPNSTITKRSFAIVKVDGPENDRALTFSFFDSKGAEIFSTTVKLSELKKFD